VNQTAFQKLNKYTLNVSRRIQSLSVWMLVLIASLGAFEYFSFSTTSFALQDMMGMSGSGPISWSVILSLAFCAVDLMGITFLLRNAPEAETNSRRGWYILGSWMVAAAMNTGLTWWGVSVAVYNTPVENALIIDPMVFVKAVPVIVAVMVWVIRVLIIGALVSSFEKQSQPEKKKPVKTGNQSFGFNRNSARVPAGYQPLTNDMRSDL